MSHREISEIEEVVSLTTTNHLSMDEVEVLIGNRGGVVNNTPHVSYVPQGRMGLYSYNRRMNQDNHLSFA